MKKQWFKCRTMVWLVASTLLPSAFSSQMALAATPLPSWVFVGDALSFPIHILEYQGQKKVAKVRIISPTGKILTDESFVALEAGRYEVHYQASFGDVLQEETESFLSIRRSVDLFQGKGDVSFTNQSLFAYDNDFSGVKSRMNLGSRFTFSKILDMSSFDQTTPLAQFMVEPSTESSADFETLHLAFQDVENPSEGFSVVLENGGALNGEGRISYLRAGGTNQLLSGYERLGDQRIFHNDGVWGTPMNHTFRGLTKETIEKSGYHPITIYYDFEENALYASTPYGQGEGKSDLVVDFGDVKDFPTNPWHGFPSKKAKLTIWGEGFHSSANVLWTSVGGYDLTKREQQDTNGPKITIDFGNESKAPDGVVGMAYPIFKSTAFDDYDDGLNVETYVTYHDERYDADINIPLEGDKIQVEKAGEYRIHYEASDRSGNFSEITVPFTAGEEIAPMTLNVPSFDTESEAFQPFLLPSLDALSVDNAYGQCAFSCVLTDPEGNEIEIKDHTFVPEESGTYYVSFSAQDYLGRKASKKIALTILPSSKPIFVGAPDLPKAFMAGFHYSLPSLKAVETGSDGKAKDVEVRCYRDGVLSDQNDWVASGDQITIRYEAVGSSNNAYIEKTIPVQNGDKGKMKSNYFYGENATLVEADESMDVTFASSGEATFLRPLSKQNFETVFRLPSTGLDGLFLRFHQKGKNATLRIHKSDDAYGVLFPKSDKEIALTNSAGFFGLSYDIYHQQFEDGLGKAIGMISFYDDGTPFDGLDEGFTFSFGFDALPVSRTLSLMRLSGQPFGHGGNPARAKDRINPIILLHNDFAVRQEVGATLTIPSASAYDVLNEIGEVTVSVKNNEETLLAETSANIPHTLTFTKLAKYRVEYKVSDAEGNEGTYLKMIDVSEKEPPVLEVDLSSIASHYQLNDVLQLPEATARDNSGSAYVLAYLLTPKNQTILLTRYGETKVSYLSKLGATIAVNDSAFRLWEEGKYRLRYVAYDESYNHMAKEAVFIVTKGEIA